MMVIIVQRSRSYTKIGTRTPYRLYSVCECSRVRIRVQKQTILPDEFHGYSVCSNKRPIIIWPIGEAISCNAFRKISSHSTVPKTKTIRLKLHAEIIAGFSQNLTNGV